MTTGTTPLAWSFLFPSPGYSLPLGSGQYQTPKYRGSTRQVIFPRNEGVRDLALLHGPRS